MTIGTIERGENVDREFFPVSLASVMKKKADCFPEMPMSTYESAPYLSPEDCRMKCFVSACFDFEFCIVHCFIVKLH
jgi:hypothetical protein